MLKARTVARRLPSHDDGEFNGTSKVNHQAAFVQSHEVLWEIAGYSHDMNVNAPRAIHS